MKNWLSLLAGSLLLLTWTTQCISPSTPHVEGQAIDSLNGVALYYDTEQDSTYPPSEFVKRYYASVMGMQLPDSLRSGADFFDPSIPDGAINPKTGLVQYTQPSRTPPRENDILVFSEARYNPGGHVGIIGEVGSLELVVYQQNAGPLTKPREPLRYYIRRKKWYVQHPHAIAWLHKEK
ncbi:MAG: CHAP domain-containing protein [Lewinellaceae bacterium]|nr:CHAP domain-containing protein [Lewinellaceae bacterium]